MDSIGEILKRISPTGEIPPVDSCGAGKVLRKFNCPICQDGGWVAPVGPDGKIDYQHPRRCRCRAQKAWENKQQSFLKFCELPQATEDRTFETFNSGHNASLKEALQAAMALADGRLKMLTLTADVDRGKTHLAIAACRDWLARGKSAKYAFVPLLLDELRAGFQNSGGHSYDARFNFYLKVGLLVLDDLGAEHKTAWSIEKLESIIDYRYINELPTMITTNCAPDDFTPRIRSRIQRARNSLIVVMDSPEYRLRKKQRQVG